jgi:Type II CAAX prenyl endopeptidase Rce1-like
MQSRAYFDQSRQPRYSLLFALPLLLLYEGLAILLSGSAMAGIRNGADVLLKTLFVSVGGRWGLLLFGLVLIGVGAWFVTQDRRANPGPLESRVFGVMVVESIIYAMIFGQIVSWMTGMLLGGGTLAVAMQSTMESLSFGTQLVVSLGAGLYEELLFRVIIVGVLIALFKRFQWKHGVVIGAAIVGSALIFSTFHYVGPYGDPLTLASFTFRAIAGVLLSGLYVWRGFGITAWTHALYDVFLAVF